MCLETQTDSPRATKTLARELAKLVRPGDVISLTGELGAGKTVFVKGMAAAIEVPDAITSPTFVILKAYLGRLPVYHFDLYRLDSIEEMAALGIEDYLSGDGVSMIEWGEKAGRLLPEERLTIEFSRGAGDNERRIRLCAHGEDWTQRLEAWAEATILPVS